MLQQYGRDWRNLSIQDMLDAAEKLLVDEVERQLLASFNEEEHGGRTAARGKIREMLYQQFVATANRDEVAKTWGMLPEHQAGLAAAMSVARTG